MNRRTCNLATLLALGLALLMALPADAAIIREKQVFHASIDSTNFGYDELSDCHGGGYDCWYHYTAGAPCTNDDPANVCLQDIGTGSNPPWAMLGKSLTKDKEIYRTTFSTYPETDGATSGFYATFSFVKGPATASTGDGETTGFFSECVQVRLKETHDGWDVSLGETTKGAYLELAKTTDNRDTSHFHAYTFIVNARAGYAALSNDLGQEILNQSLVNHQGLAMHSAWIMGRAYGDFGSAHLDLSLNGDSTGIWDMDPQPPVISDVKQNPLTVAANQAYTVSATATGDWDAPAVVVKHWVNGIAGRDIPTTRVGATVSATMPAQSQGVKDRYQFVATSSNGLSSMSDVYELTIGGTSGPKNLGGGSAGSAAGSVNGLAGSWGGMPLWVGLVLVVLGVVTFFFVEDENRKQATLLGVGLMLTGFIVWVVGSTWDAIAAWFAGLGAWFANVSPYVWALVGVLALLVVYVLGRRLLERRKVSP